MTNPDQVFLTREQLRVHLGAIGYQVAATYFHKICLPSVNAGPPVAKWFGRRPLYTLADGIAWAESRCRPVAQSAA